MSFTFSCCPIQQEESQQRHHTVNVRVPQTMAEAPISVPAASTASPNHSQVNEEEVKQEVPEVQPEAEEEKEEETALEEHKRDYSCVQVHRRY